MSHDYRIPKLEFLIQLLEAQTQAQKDLTKSRRNPNDENLRLKSQAEMRYFTRLEEIAIVRGFRSVRAEFDLVPADVPLSATRPKVTFEDVDWDQVPKWDPSWGTVDDVDVYLHHMQILQSFLTNDDERVLGVRLARELWIRGISHMGGKVLTVANAINLANTWSEMEEIFRDWFTIPGSKSSIDLRILAWHEEDSAVHFCMMFQAAMYETELSLTDRATRETMAQLFVVHFPRSWELDDMLKAYDRAPPLKELVSKVQFMSRSFPMVEGTGLGYHQLEVTLSDENGDHDDSQGSNWSRTELSQSNNEQQRSGRGSGSTTRGNARGKRSSRFRNRTSRKAMRERSSASSGRCSTCDALDSDCDCVRREEEERQPRTDGRCFARRGGYSGPTEGRTSATKRRRRRRYLARRGGHNRH
ncbi:hypothetical protein B0O80DRAFT_432951 [Mortierella sp. GBAus27b]|nr:hypothetical protein B0O80DRAFT_432951 [Mortierella sp. GBAus27b]